MEKLLKKKPIVSLIDYVLVSLISIALTGCINIPNLDNVNVVQIPQTNMIQTQKVISDQWWKKFNDEQFNNLMNIIFDNNKDIKIAQLNIEKIIKSSEIINADSMPQVNLSSNFQKERLSANGFYPAPLGGSNINFSQIGLHGTYNPDLFGKISSLVNEKNLQVLGEKEKKSYTEFSLSVQTFKLYAYYQYLLELEDILNDQQSLAEQLNNLSKKKILIGIGSEKEELVSDNSLKDIFVLKKQLESNKNNTLASLAQLTGNIKENNALLNFKKTDLLHKMITPENEINSEAIINKHDIQYYLLNIQAQKENLNSLKSDFYPSISITGDIGLQKIGFNQLFKSGNIFGNIGPTINLPIFDAGRIKNNYKIGGLDLNTFIEQYNKSVINAYYDVNDKLYNVKINYEILNLQNSYFENEKKKLKLSEQKYQLGKSSSYDLKQEKMNYLVQKNNYLKSQLTYFNTQIELINSLGGIINK